MAPKDKISHHPSSDGWCEIGRIRAGSDDEPAKLAVNPVDVRELHHTFMRRTRRSGLPERELRATRRDMVTGVG